MAIPAPQISSKTTLPQTLSFSTLLALLSRTCVGWEAFCHPQHVDTAAFMCSSEVSIEPIQRWCVNACSSQCTVLTCRWRTLPFNTRDLRSWDLLNPWLTQACMYFVYLNKAFLSFPPSSLGSSLWHSQEWYGDRRHVRHEAGAHHEVHHPRSHGGYYSHLRLGSSGADRQQHRSKSWASQVSSVHDV